MTYFVWLIFLNTLMAQDIRIMESLSFFSKILGQEVKYSICLPEDYFKENRSYPVVYLLHGLGDDETSWLEYGQINRIADKAVREKTIIPMIYLMPQGFRSYYTNEFAGKFRYQDMFIQELIPYIDTHYRTIADREHRATMGYSMGG
ncbi:MAG: alpha/beta hydrolase-fold protein, partial [Mariniphaga sp.]